MKALQEFHAWQRHYAFVEAQDAAKAGGTGLGNDQAVRKVDASGFKTGQCALHGGEQNLVLAGGMAEYLTSVLNNAVDREAAESEQGLTVLASAGSAAPYIGLFGTVWGIYHALVQIGMSGQGTLDKVAGPAGCAYFFLPIGTGIARRGAQVMAASARAGSVRIGFVSGPGEH